MAGITLEVITNDITAATTWANLHITETIGEPDRLTVGAVGFTSNALFTAIIQTLFAVDNRYAYVVVRLDDDILFGGVIRKFDKDKPTQGAITYALQGDGWEFLVPKRLVGVPNGDEYVIQEDGDPSRLPAGVAVDPSAIGAPVPAQVKSLWQAYWNFPEIDLDTFVTAVLPEGATVPDQITWSGSDLAGATSDLAALGSAAALWWLAHDSPDPQDAILAPNLALHWGVVVMPDDGDDGDDLLAGFPSADPLSVIAPFEIDNDTPNGTTRILPLSVSFSVDNLDRDGGVYVRGGTGDTLDIVPAGSGYVVGDVIKGGTGWVGGHGTEYGESYIDAPAAITPDQRDAFGNAYLASRQIPKVTGKIRVTEPGCHKGQGVKVTDSDYGYAGRWFLIRSVDLTAKSPDGDFEYALEVGDTLSASLGFALRQQRLAEQRKPVAPATKFVPYVFDLQLATGETAPVTMQLANDAGMAIPLADVGCEWHLMVDGVDQTDVEDVGALYYLTDIVETTDVKGQTTATLNGGPGVTAANVCNPWAKMVMP